MQRKRNSAETGRSPRGGNKTGRSFSNKTSSGKRYPKREENPETKGTGKRNEGRYTDNKNSFRAPYKKRGEGPTEGRVYKGTNNRRGSRYEGKKDSFNEEDKRQTTGNGTRGATSGAKRGFKSERYSTHRDSSRGKDNRRTEGRERKNSSYTGDQSGGGRRVDGVGRKSSERFTEQRKRYPEKKGSYRSADENRENKRESKSSRSYTKTEFGKRDWVTNKRNRALQENTSARFTEDNKLSGSVRRNREKEEFTEGDKPAFKGKASDRNKKRGTNRSERRTYVKKEYRDGSKRKRETQEPKEGPQPDGMRLNKFIANSGISSRRDADQYIKTGVVTVNGKVVTEMGYRVKLTDIVKFGDRTIKPEKPVYIVLNKPKDFITTTDDPGGRNTVTSLINIKERIFPIGRLDRNTTGVLLLTNDGDFAERLMHPKYNISKVYLAILDKNLKPEHLEQLKSGVDLEDGRIAFDDVAYVAGDKKSIGVQIHSGRNRIIHRTFEHLGYKVDKLDRTSYAGLTKKDLKRGDWRYLTAFELMELKKGVKLKGKY